MLMTEAEARDNDFHDVVIEKVRSFDKGGWQITHDGMSFAIPSESPVAPEVGMAVRFYPKAILGCRIRGLFLDGECVFYRTEEEDKEKAQIELYGADAADLLARWDAGRGVFSIDMGGMGPGYEQALQITVFEILRDLLTRKPDMAAWEDKDAWTAERDLIDANVSPIVSSLGLSGAQWGAALSLAVAFYMRGPRQCLGEKADRQIQVSNSFPHLAGKPEAT